MSRHTKHWAVGLSLCMLLLAAGARAEDKSEPAEYREVIRHALQEFDQGHYAEAGALFERAHRLFPNARTLWGLGLVAFEDRDYAGAIVHLEASLQDSRRPLIAAQRAQGEKVLKDAWEFVAAYNLKLEPETASMLVDGRAPQTARDLVLLNPGSHEFVVEAPEYQQIARRVEAKSGERGDLTFELESEDAVAAPSEPRPTQTPVAATTRSQQSEPPMWLAYTLVGTGGALLAGALVTGLMSNHDYNELDSRCGSDKRCPADFNWRSVRSDGEHMALAANVLALSGVLVAGTGAVLWYVWGKQDSEAPQAALACVPGTCMSHVRVVF